MKLAHLILAHHNPAQLKRLVSRLGHTDTDIYIHIDLKTEIAPFLEIGEMSNVFFVQNRVKVYWGAYSQVQAILNGFEAIINSGKNYAYINLLSGQDYPIQSNDSITGFLEANPGKAFMEFYSVQDVWKEAIPRISEYHLDHYHFPGKYILQRLMNKILPVRKLPYSMEAVGRATWFTITGEHVKYILKFLNEHRSVRSYFKMVWGVDELIFQTILFNSPYKEAMVNDHLRYIDWSAGGVNPKTFNMEDAGVILESDKLFARKFDGVTDNPLLTLIDNKLMSGEKKYNQ